MTSKKTPVAKKSPVKFPVILYNHNTGESSEPLHNHEDVEAFMLDVWDNGSPDINVYVLDSSLMIEITSKLTRTE